MKEELIAFSENFLIFQLNDVVVADWMWGIPCNWIYLSDRSELKRNFKIPLYRNNSNENSISIVI